MSTMTGIVSDAQLQQFQDEGYMILERAIPDEHLQMLREECQMFIEMMDKAMDAKGVEQMGLNMKGNRYFVSNQFQQSERMHEFIFSPVMAEVTQATLGPNVWLFHEQWVVKAAEKGAKFSWHQDSGYVGYPHPPYLTCWCPIDDVNEENGTVYVLPYSRAGTRERVEHVRDEATNDKIGYHGDDLGVPVICPAGSIVAFSSTLFHRSGFNTTDKMRRVYLPQYSAGPMRRPDGSVSNVAIEFVRDGEIVATPETIFDKSASVA